MTVTKLRNVDWGKCRALFTLTTSEGFEIHNMRLVNGINGFYVAGPSEKGKDGAYHRTVWVPDSMQKQLTALVSVQYDPGNKTSQSMPTPETTNDIEIPF